MALLAIGQDAIMSALGSLPATKHDSSPAGLVVDAFLCASDMLCVCLHGHFEEVVQQGTSGELIFFPTSYILTLCTALWGL